MHSKEEQKGKHSSVLGYVKTFYLLGLDSGDFFKIKIRYRCTWIQTSSDVQMCALRHGTLQYRKQASTAILH